MMKRALLLCLGVAVIGTALIARAAESEADAGPSGIKPDASVPPQTSTSSPQQKGKRRSEKDAEGTQAPNRFEADPVIKSRYELDGQPLEVDPD